MAQKVNIILVDDLDGGTAEETIAFGLDGTGYEIDLSVAHAEKLRNALKPYVEAARKNTARGGRGRGRGSRAGAANSNDISRIRQWARDNGYTVSDRGRIQADIVEAYHKANG
ncbi:Lsr2 family protein [Acaricomes phytoseiuli]|uniref:histone-like nucleoid-structuring protein Lsr2 n=1 Tax=Acaricomes phytoseiuli TaxID=291968 RepID=UPI00035D47C5|nr:Lsr2 family protein [Acaricomes phytoseiuli]MCW1249224.1 Lsr2 family protein [Acaricomes phytoseiuli]